TCEMSSLVKLGQCAGEFDRIKLNRGAGAEIFRIRGPHPVILSAQELRRDASGTDQHDLTYRGDRRVSPDALARLRLFAGRKYFNDEGRLRQRTQTPVVGIAGYREIRDPNISLGPNPRNNAGRDYDITTTADQVVSK